MSKDDGSATTNSYKWKYDDLKNKVAADVGRIAVTSNVADNADQVAAAVRDSDHNKAVGCNYAEENYAKKTEVKSDETLNARYLNRTVTGSQTVAGKVTFSKVPEVPKSAMTGQSEVVNVKCMQDYVLGQIGGVPVTDGHMEEEVSHTCTASETVFEHTAKNTSLYLIRLFKFSDGAAVLVNGNCVDIPYVRTIGKTRFGQTVVPLKVNANVKIVASVKLDSNDKTISAGSTKFTKNAVIRIYKLGVAG